jgi:hypothetical protein
MPFSGVGIERLNERARCGAGFVAADSARCTGMAVLERSRVVLILPFARSALGRFVPKFAHKD